MVNLWHKYKSAPKRKKQTLHSIIAGFALFCVLLLLSMFLPFPICPIKNIFGIDCPGCGLMRGFICILSLELAEATAHNVLSVPLFFCIAVYSLLCLCDIFFDLDFIDAAESFCKRRYMIIIFTVAYLLCASINLIF